MEFFVTDNFNNDHLNQELIRLTLKNIETYSGNPRVWACVLYVNEIKTATIESVGTDWGGGGFHKIIYNADAFSIFIKESETFCQITPNPKPKIFNEKWLSTEDGKIEFLIYFLALKDGIEIDVNP